MFRKPRFNRPLRRGIVANVPPALRHANRLYADGRFLDAAIAFEELAHGAELRGIPQAAQLYMAAGRCRLELRQPDLAVKNFKRGLSMLAGQGRPILIQRAEQHCISDLSKKGYLQEANEINQMVKGFLPEAVEIEKPETASPLVHLPAVCPSCGGTLRSDEVDWIDDNSAECPWCGSSIMSA